jgi:hypothetical protein
MWHESEKKPGVWYKKGEREGDMGKDTGKQPGDPAEGEKKEHVLTPALRMALTIADAQPMTGIGESSVLKLKNRQNKYRTDEYPTYDALAAAKGTGPQLERAQETTALLLRAILEDYTPAFEDLLKLPREERHREADKMRKTLVNTLIADGIAEGTPYFMMTTSAWDTVRQQILGVEGVSMPKVGEADTEIRTAVQKVAKKAEQRGDSLRAKD